MSYINRNIILNNNKIRENYCDKEVIVFGAGVDGSNFCKYFSATVTIKCIIDNIKDNVKVLGVPVHNFKFLDNFRTRNEIIIVATRNYYEEIAKQLWNAGYEPGKDYVIWQKEINIDEEYNTYKENLKQYINYNKSIWGDCKRVNKKNKVLMPCRCLSNLAYIPWSYSVNALAQKYDAEIWGFGWDIGRKEGYENEDTWEVYQSINMCDCIDTLLSIEQRIEADLIYEKIILSKKTREDYKNIVVYGEDFGEDIISDYLRIVFPIIDIEDSEFKNHLKEMIELIVFWHYYFINHNEVNAVMLWDGIYREGIIRRIAFGHGIPVYSVVYSACWKWKNEQSFCYQYYKKFFYQLTENEREQGIKWAKRKMNERLQGSIEGLPSVATSAFSAKWQKRVLDDNDKVKVMICPHYFEDEAYPYGEMIYNDPWDWLCNVGELSKKTSYDWYLKMHPIEREMGKELIKRFLKEYPHIKLIDKNVSPLQLKEEGMQFALTIHGSIGHEYPAIGIQVINAGNNPHMSFDFDWNPKTQEEYEELLTNLEGLNKQIDMEEIYAFYCIHYLYYRQRKRVLLRLFYKDSELQDPARGLEGSKLKHTSDVLIKFMKECTPKRHEELKEIFRLLFEEVDEYQDGVFYRVDDSKLYKYFN